MYNFLHSYDLNRAAILNWTSANPDRIELLYKNNQFMLDAHLDMLASYMPFDGDEDDDKAVDEYCKRLDTVWENCSVTARLALDFLDEEPVAAFFVEIVQPDGERLEGFAYCDISAETAAELIADCLRHGAGLTEQAANGYRNALLLYRLVRVLGGEHVPDDEFSHIVLDLLQAGRTPQAIADGIGAA